MNVNQPGSTVHVSQIVQPRLFLMTEMPECSVSLTTGRRRGAARQEGERQKITRATPLPMHHSEIAIARQHSADGRSFAGRMRPWPASKMGCVQTAAGLIAVLCAACMSIHPRSGGMYRQGWQIHPGYMWHLCSLLPCPSHYRPCLLAWPGLNVRE